MGTGEAFGEEGLAERKPVVCPEERLRFGQG
jgi:hypothetical protein